MFASAHSSAYVYLRSVKGQIPGGYNFLVYTPNGYSTSQANTPVLIFLHGASLCGHNLNRVRRYGPLDALLKGRRIDALTVVPQNPGGAWNPKKVMQVLEWVKANYRCDTTRVYVLGMSLGGYGTMDVCGTYPDRIAAGMALCGGTSLKDVSGLGKLPFWIIHGTGDRTVPISHSKVVVSKLQSQHNDSRLRFLWFRGGNHGTPAHILYLQKTYDWLLSHSLLDKDRAVNKDISISDSDVHRGYSGARSNVSGGVIVGDSCTVSNGN